MITGSSTNISVGEGGGRVSIEAVWCMSSHLSLSIIRVIHMEQTGTEELSSLSPDLIGSKW